MKNIITFIISFTFLLYSPILSSQSIAEQLNGAVTDFIITNNDEDMQVISQVVVPRDRSEYRSDWDTYRVYDRQELFLEFVCKNRIKVREEQIPIDFRAKNAFKEEIALVFYAEDGTILLEKNDLSFWDMRSWESRIGTSGSDLYNYRINLTDYSVSLLEITDRVEFRIIRKVYNQKKS